MNSPGGGMNGPAVSVRASEARVSHRLGGTRRHRSAGPPALKGLATCEDPDGLQRTAAGLPFPVPRANTESFTGTTPADSVAQLLALVRAGLVP